MSSSVTSTNTETVEQETAAACTPSGDSAPPPAELVTSAGAPAPPQVTQPSDVATTGGAAPCPASSTKYSALQMETLNTFIDILRQFVDQIGSVFPECTETKVMILKFSIGVTNSKDKDEQIKVKKKLITNWHKKMQPFYDDVKKRDVRVIEQVSQSKTFSSIKLWEKWNDPKVHPSTHKVIWKYIDTLNKYCQMYVMYAGIPTNMMNSIQTMATSMAKDMEEGRGLNTSNLADIGRKITSDMKPAEMQQFAKNMMSNMNVITSLCSSMIGDMGKSNGGTASGSTGAGGAAPADFGNLLANVSKTLQQTQSKQRRR